MTTETTENYIVLRPAEGKVLRNAAGVESESVYLPLGGDPSEWEETDPTDNVEPLNEDLWTENL